MEAFLSFPGLEIDAVSSMISPECVGVLGCSALMVVAEVFSEAVKIEVPGSGSACTYSPGSVHAA
jgi:hypothetical protein